MAVQCGNKACIHCYDITSQKLHNCECWTRVLRIDCGFYEHVMPTQETEKKSFGSLEEDDGFDEWNDGYYLEGVDRCNTIRVMFEELLLDHPAILKLDDGTEQYLHIQDLLGELYQSLGRYMIHKEK